MYASNVFTWNVFKTGGGWKDLDLCLTFTIFLYRGKIELIKQINE